MFDDDAARDMKSFSLHAFSSRLDEAIIIHDMSI